MKITEVDVHVLAPLGPERTLGGSRVGWVFVEVHTDAGITGIGEASNWPRSGDLLVGHALRTVREQLRGRDPFHTEAIWNELFRNYTYLGSRGLVTAVISGIDIALWDIKGKALGKPVYDLLGGPVRPRVPLYTHPHGGTPDEAAANAVRQTRDEGYGAVKMDPFAEMLPFHTHYQGGQISARGLREGAAWVQAVREAVHTDVEILIDFHGHYNVASALKAIRALEPYGVTWFEEPVPPEGYDALRQIRRQTHADLCVGERLFTRWDFLPVLREGLANYVMPDVCWTGGISELRKIATMAEAYFVPVAPHGALGPLQLVAGAHVVATVPNFYRLEIVSSFLDVYNAALSRPVDIRDGHLHLPETPGLGFELNHDFIREHPDPDWDL